MSIRKLISTLLLLLVSARPVHGQVAPGQVAPGQAAPGQAADPGDSALAMTQYAREAWTTDDGLPQASILSIVQTRDGYLWLGTQEGVVRYDGREFDVFRGFAANPAKNTVTALHECPSGVLWIGTRGGGIAALHNGEFTPLTIDDGLASNFVTGIRSDSTGAIWVSGETGGLSRIVDDSITTFGPYDGLPSEAVSAMLTTRSGGFYVAAGDSLVRFNGTRFVGVRISPAAGSVAGSATGSITSLAEADDGSIWIGTDSRGILALRGEKLFTPDFSDDLPQGSVSTILDDNAGNIWVGYLRSGLARIRNGQVEVMSTDNGLTSRNIRALIEDREGSVWVGTDGGGLVRLRTGRFVNFTTTEGLPHNIALGVYATADGAVWVGTEEGGVTRISDGRMKRFTRHDGLPSESVYSISSTADGSMWFGTAAGLARLRDGSITVFKDRSIGLNGSVYGLFTDSKDRLWVATDNKLLRYEGNDSFQVFDTSHGLPSGIVNVVAEDAGGDLWVGTHDAGVARMRGDSVIAVFDNDRGLLSETVTALYADPDGTMWVGLRDGGLSRIATDGAVTNFTTETGLFDNSVHHIEVDADGAFWMTSNRGLFTVPKQQLVDYAEGNRTGIHSRSFSRADGLQTNEFNAGFQPAGTKSDDGRLWFPSMRGVVAVDSRNLGRNEVAPLVVIEEVLIDGHLVSNGDRVAPGGRRLDIEFAGLSFIVPEKTTFLYQLSGVDDDWHDGGSATTASYTNLKPGSYTFQIRAANADGVWSDQSSFSFVLRPFFYQSPWFVLLSIAGFLWLVLLIHRLRVSRLKQQHRELERLVAERTHDLETALLATEHARVDVEKQKERAEEARAVIEVQADKLREMDRIKSRFFGNISHEFRTPLTLTIGPLENALTGVYGALSPKLEKQLELMLRNSRRLLRLINQLLDLSKLESGRLPLRPQMADISTLVEGVVLSFSAFAESEQISLEFEPDDDANFEVAYDNDAMEKVFFNLLSNAVKFTPKGGAIRVRMQDTAEAVVVHVTDTGAGIRADELPHIFDRFHQVDGTVSRVQEGTGIGLALVKELVTLHGGTIIVESEPGKGTQFSVSVRKGVDHFEEIFDSVDALESEVTHGPMVEMAVFEDLDLDLDLDIVAGGDGTTGEVEVELEVGGNRPTILVVDDSRDIRNYIVSCLGGRYAVITASDGVEALEIIRRHPPDLILSDVMMPRMDGHELCRAVKSDEELRHIPVVMLTSKASVEARIEGFESGSDDHLPKPFNAKELRTRIENLLRSRKQSAELLLLNRALVEKNEALRQATEMKSELLSIASHEVKNPLTSIREFARILKGEVGESSHMNELLDLIYSSSNEMLQLVTQLLDSDALEGGQILLDKRPVDIKSLVEIVVHRNRAQAKAKGQTIVFDTPEKQPMIVMADFERLREAMDNLVSNAVKYSPLDAPIHVSVEQDSCNVRFMVRDEGPGLTRDDKRRLFGRFQRLTAQPTGGESSNGLGLSIVKQVIDLHDGKVWAKSKLGKGTTFVIELKTCTENEIAEYEAKFSDRAA